MIHIQWQQHQLIIILLLMMNKNSLQNKHKPLLKDKTRRSDEEENEMDNTI